ncbi:myosin III [Sarotherodon galilaeus]
MNTATADLQSPHPWSLLYADDVCLSETENCLALQTQTQAWKDQLSENGMRLNIKKTEYLECGPQTNSTITIDSEPLTKVAQFKYLGSLVTSDCETLPDARLRVNTAWMKWHQVSGIVRPVALYGSECWPATTKHEQSLHTREMKMLRWKQWGYGHVVRSDKNSIAKTAQQSDLDGNRPQGRPKKRWMDRIKDDMKAVNVTPEDALDRKKWRKACKIADLRCGI